jgi:hypothetical protein
MEDLLTKQRHQDHKEAIFSSFVPEMKIGQLSVAVFDAETTRARIEELAEEISQVGFQVSRRLRAMDEAMNRTLAGDP